MNKSNKCHIEFEILLVSNVVKIFDKLKIDEHWRRLRINNDNQLFCIRIICICALKRKENWMRNNNLIKLTLMFENKNYSLSNQLIEKEYGMLIHK
jgi:hypothetical protein